MSHGSEFLDQVMQLSSVVSQELKHWADQEFGGVRAAFRVLDKEGTGGHRKPPGMSVRRISTHGMDRDRCESS